MYRLIYTSRATADFDDDQLDRLLAKCKANNRRDGITGMLCYWNGMFAQCLEGAERDVYRTFARIEKDPRHTEVDLLLRAEIPERHFGDWAMHLITLDENVPSTTLIRRKYPRLDPGDLLFRDPLVVFSLLFDLGLVARGAA